MRSSALSVVTAGSGVAARKKAAIVPAEAPGSASGLLAQLPPATSLVVRAFETIRSPDRSNFAAFSASVSPAVWIRSSMFADQLRHGSSLLLLLRCCSVVYESQVLPDKAVKPFTLAVLLLAV